VRVPSRQPSSIERWEPAEGPPHQGGGPQGSGSAGERLVAAQQLLQNLRLLPATAQPAANGAASEASTQGAQFTADASSALGCLQNLTQSPSRPELSHHILDRKHIYSSADTVASAGEPEAVQKLLAEAEAAIATAASTAMEAERAAADAGVAKEEAEHARRFAYHL